jgi:hypothetical protein
MPIHSSAPSLTPHPPASCFFIIAPFWNADSDASPALGKARVEIRSVNRKQFQAVCPKRVAVGPRRECHPDKETTVIGCEQSEQLDVEPAQYFVRVTKRENEPVKLVKSKESGVRRCLRELSR